MAMDVTLFCAYRLGPNRHGVLLGPCITGSEIQVDFCGDLSHHL